MSAFVVDTNVAVVANGGESEQANDLCILECTLALQEVVSELVVIDDAGHIISEYRRKLDAYRKEQDGNLQDGPGDRFFRWLLQNQGYEERVERVSITPHETRTFAEFPDDPDLADFDPSDRKFAAVALTSEHKPIILNAVDSDWSLSEPALTRNGVRVKELCPDCLKAD